MVRVLRATAGEHEGHGGCGIAGLLRGDPLGIPALEQVDSFARVDGGDGAAVRERLAADLKRVCGVGEGCLGVLAQEPREICASPRPAPPASSPRAPAAAVAATARPRGPRSALPRG